MVDGDLYVETEFLVLGSFREDESDGGFQTTRWLPATELEDVVTVEGGCGVVNDAMQKLDDLVDGLKQTLNID